MKYKLITINKAQEKIYETTISSIEGLWKEVIRHFYKVKRGENIHSLYLYGWDEKSDTIPQEDEGKWLGWRVGEELEGSLAEITLSPGRIKQSIKHDFGHEIIERIKERTDGGADEEKVLGQWLMLDIIDAVGKE